MKSLTHAKEYGGHIFVNLFQQAFQLDMDAYFEAQYNGMNRKIPKPRCEHCNGSGIGLSFNERNVAKEVPGGCKKCGGSGEKNGDM